MCLRALPSRRAIGRGRQLHHALRKWFKRVGLAYHSPHKFRHGHAVYALKLAKDVAVLKTVSQNLMHENLTVTHVVYGVLSDTDVGKRIRELGVYNGRRE
jgi:integrase